MSSEVIAPVKQSLKCSILAYGGSFENMVAHYQLESQKYLPQSLSLTLRLGEIVRNMS